MRGSRSSSRLVKDRNSVADQPGRVVLFIGVLISLFVGLTVRGLIHPTKIRALVESAASRISPEIHVRFESASIALSDGWLPDLALVVEGIKMDSSNTCWMAPRLSVDRLRLPLSVIDFLIGRPPFQKVQAGDIEVRLTSEIPSGCTLADAKTLPTNLPATGPSEPKQVVTLVRKAGPQVAAEAPTTAGVLEDLQIDRLVIISDVPPVKGTLDLNRIEFSVRSVHPRVLQLKAQTNLLKDHDPDFLSTAHLLAEYKEFPQKALSIRLSGNIREGSYNLNGDYDPDSDQLKSSAEVRHLPLGQILSIFKQMHWLETNFEPHQSWISFRAEGDGPLKKIGKQPLRLNEFHVEGDLGEMKSTRIEVRSLDPVTVAPFRVEIASLNLDRLLQFLNQPHPSPVLNHLGQFRGVADFEDAENFQMLGEQNGLEFIFANKGRREIQSISGIESELRRDHGLWQLRVSQAHLEQGNFQGEAKLSGDAKLKELDLGLRVDDLALKAAVQKLMTQGGELAPMNGRLQLHISSGQLTKLKGVLHLPHLQIEDMGFEKLILNFDEAAGQILLTPKADSVTMAQSSPGWQLLGPMIPPAWIREKNLVMNSVTGQVHVKSLQELQWTHFTAKTETGQVSTDGAWSPEGRLDGRISIRDGQTAKVWRIEGTRDQPQLIEARP